MTTRLAALQDWVDSVARLTQPEDIHWCQGSESEYKRLVNQMQRSGDLLELDQEAYPHCYLHRSDPSDVARVEHAGIQVRQESRLFEYDARGFGEITRGLEAPRSLANSAALIRFPGETRGDWVRPGIMLYGCSPFSDQSAEALGLQPAMTLSSELIAVESAVAEEGRARQDDGSLVNVCTRCNWGAVECVADAQFVWYFQINVHCIMKPRFFIVVSILDVGICPPGLFDGHGTQILRKSTVSHKQSAHKYGVAQG